MNLAEKYGIDLSKEHKTQCPRCARNGKDKSKNNLQVYGEDAGAYCFACGFTIPSLAYMEEMGWAIEDEEDYAEVMTQEKITQEEAEKIKSYTGVFGKGLRGITDKTYKAYGVRHKMSEETGDPVAQYYPITEGYEGSGYKVRTLPKTFSVIGKMGTDSDLFGQWRFKNSSGKYVLITSGEIDCLSAYQMLENYREGRGSDFDPIPVVSGVVGEKSSAKQIQKQYEWLSRFEKIILCPDNDAAGREAVHKIAKVIPKGKLFVMQLSLKDANEMLEQGKEKQFVSSFFSAKPYTPAGIVGSGELYEMIIEEASSKRIPFPPFMEKLNEMTGQIALGKIVNIGAGSGLGKTVYVNEMIYYWIFNSPHRVGVVSMELNCGQYGMVMLSRHLGRKIAAIRDDAERLEFLLSDEVQAKQRELFYTESGDNRWHLVDDRDGSVEDLKAKVEELVISCGCKVIVLDPLQDILDGMDIDTQAVFLKWQKGLIKSHNMTFININHIRKAGSGEKASSTGAMINEESFAGSSTIFKSASLNILLTRDKLAEDEIERNTTYAYLSKNRDTGITGPCGEYYFDNATHTLWNKEEYMRMHPQVF